MVFFFFVSAFSMTIAQAVRGVLSGFNLGTQMHLWGRTRYLVRRNSDALLACLTPVESPRALSLCGAAGRISTIG